MADSCMRSRTVYVIEQSEHSFCDLAHIVRWFPIELVALHQPRFSGRLVIFRRLDILCNLQVCGELLQLRGFREAVQRDDFVVFDGIVPAANVLGKRNPQSVRLPVIFNDDSDSARERAHAKKRQWSQVRMLSSASAGYGASLVSSKTR